MMREMMMMQPSSQSHSYRYSRHGSENMNSMVMTSDYIEGSSNSRQSLVPSPTTALAMLQQPRHRLCLLQQPNLCLEMGITQLAGPAGAGKTQMALTLCVACVLDGKKAVYISLGSSTHGVGLTKTSLRLRSMFAANAYEYLSSPQDQPTHAMLRKLLSQIYVHGIRNSEDLMELLEEKLPRLLRMDPDISLVVLDSIASLFRVNEEVGNNNYNGHENLKSFANRNNYHNSPWKNRAFAFFKLATHCKRISAKCQVPFVIVNDATVKMVPSPWDSRVVSSSVEPALGLSWSQCVNESYFVTRSAYGDATTPSSSQSQTPQSHTQRQAPNTTARRVLRCLRSPKVAADTTIAFQIDSRGAVPIT